MTKGLGVYSNIYDREVFRKIIKLCYRDSSDLLSHKNNNRIYGRQYIDNNVLLPMYEEVTGKQYFPENSDYDSSKRDALVKKHTTKKKYKLKGSPSVPVLKQLTHIEAKALVDEILHKVSYNDINYIEQSFIRKYEPSLNK